MDCVCAAWGWGLHGGCCAVVDCTISVNRCHDSIAFVVLLLDHLSWTLMAAESECWALGEGGDLCKQRALIGRWATAEEAAPAKTISPTAAACPLGGNRLSPPPQSPSIAPSPPPLRLLSTLSSPDPHSRYQPALSVSSLIRYCFRGLAELLKT